MLRSTETIAAVCLGLALLLAGLSEMAGLAMIIGAYIMGLSLSGTDLVNELQGQLRGLYNFLIPVFFCVMGMLVDFGAMRGMVLFGLVYSLLAIFSKIVGCWLPAWLLSFTPRGALRIGAGMVPRAEVALIVAGIGLSAGAIGPDVFGVAIMMSMMTTITAPPLLLKAFEGGSGVRGRRADKEDDEVSISLDFPHDDLAELLCQRIVRAFRDEEFFVHRLPTDVPTYQVRKDTMVFTMIRSGGTVRLNMPPAWQHVARMIVLEELLSLQDLLDSVKKMKSPDSMGTELMAGLFG
jgi:Kef-type K+ transport system membrane component KefB